MGRAVLVWFAFPQVIALRTSGGGSSRYSRKRPQQDSNLRTRLRSALPCTPFTCGNVSLAAVSGRLWGRCLPIPLRGLSAFGAVIGSSRSAARVLSVGRGRLGFRSLRICRPLRLVLRKLRALSCGLGHGGSTMCHSRWPADRWQPFGSQFAVAGTRYGHLLTGGRPSTTCTWLRAPDICPPDHRLARRPAAKAHRVLAIAVTQSRNHNMISISAHSAT
jgi:hypothetical protein